MIATDESAIVTEPFLYAAVVEDGESNGCFTNPPWTDKSDWSEIFDKTNNTLDELLAPEAGPGRLGR